jgi:glycosyltransferase involved in cell wall biosynthesis
MKVPFDYQDHGVLEDKQLASLYRRATVGLVLSSTNPSIVPLEMMACGLPVLDLHTDATAAEFPLATISLARPTPEAIAMDLDRLLGDRALRERQGQRARDYVAALCWETSARSVERALLAGIGERERTTTAAARTRPLRRRSTAG